MKKAPSRRTKSLEVPIPILYLKGISTGDFEEVLAALRDCRPAAPRPNDKIIASVSCAKLKKRRGRGRVRCRRAAV